MTSKVMLYVLIHVNKLTVRYHDSNFRFVELSKNAKRPHILRDSRLKPVAKLEIMENTKMLLYSDQPFRKTSNLHLISCMGSAANKPKIMLFQPEPLIPTNAGVISNKKFLTLEFY